MKDNTQKIFSLIEKNVANLSTPLIIGISGTYTSGKTHFADGLAQYLQSQGKKTQLIHYDDFHYPFADINWTQKSGDEINAFYNNAFDYEKLIEEVISPLKQHGVIKKEIDCIDLGSGKHTNKIHVDINEETIVILEGVLLFRSPLLHFLDYKVFLEISVEEMLSRGSIRDVPKFGQSILDLYKSRYIPVHHRHLDEDSPREVADMVIDNTSYINPIVIK
ncbi:uridine kinase [Raoultella sp. BIGb0149]|uniref:hypothetical protein n=1 Tax=unclassified Raoultella TaxID=2627600 RepID=UPI0010DF2A0A|nr:MULTISPECIES: hypothetical protein [unclassified Raoultella]TDQ26763.1 uridine kinase [Raoultella sp. BIGb0149]